MLTHLTGLFGETIFPPLSLWHIRKFLAKVTCASNFRKKTCAGDFRKCAMTHLKVETRKLQVKIGVSWVLLYFEYRLNLTTTTTIIFFVIFNVKSYFQLLCTVLPQWNSGQLRHAFLTGQSQLTVCERKLSGIELVLFLKANFRM